MKGLHRTLQDEPAGVESRHNIPPIPNWRFPPPKCTLLYLPSMFLLQLQYTIHSVEANTV